LINPLAVIVAVCPAEPTAVAVVVKLLVLVVSLAGFTVTLAMLLLLKSTLPTVPPLSAVTLAVNVPVAEGLRLIPPIDREQVGADTTHSSTCIVVDQLLGAVQVVELDFTEHRTRK
jgi:hypothetical protein